MNSAKILMLEETRLVSWRSSRWSVTVILEDLWDGADTAIIAVVVAVATEEMEELGVEAP